MCVYENLILLFSLVYSAIKMNVRKLKVSFSVVLHQLMLA